MQYTNSQKILLEKLDKFFNSDLDVFIIKGYAGTGKTFMTKKIIDILKKKNTAFSLMAPTGKATEVLYKKTNEQTQTIHSSIYSVEKFDIKNNKLYFSLKQNNIVNSYFIVDEASMISNIENESDSLKFGSGKLLDDLIKFINFPKNKLIIIGDIAQLPPVNMNESPALNKTTFLEKNLKVDEYLMKDVVRQKDNSILENATYLRNKIKDGIFNQIELKYDDKFTKLENNFIEEYLVTKNSIIIAHTNNMVYNYNQQFRQFIYEDINNIYENETLMVIQNNKFNDIFLANGSFIKVLNVGLQEIKKVPLTGRDKPIILTFRNITAKVNDITFETKILENTLFSPNSNLTKDESVAIYVDFDNRTNKLSKLEKEQKLLTDPYVNALRVKFGYAITCHKAQGSEWDTIFIDAKYSNSKLSRDYYKWLYTAITRAKEKVFITNPPHINLFENLQIDDNFEENKFITSSSDNKFNIQDKFLLTLYQKIKTITDKNEIKIINHESTQYQEVYTFEFNDEVITISFFYNKKQIISHIQSKTQSINSSILENLFANLKNTPIFAEEKSEFKFQEKFLEEFYQKMLKKLPKNIKIVNIEHFQYKERYTFKRDDEIVKVDFNYNGKKTFTKSQLLDSNSGNLANDINKLL